MTLKMKTSCEACNANLDDQADCFICSYECTFCHACKTRLNDCPNCGGDLVARPKRGEITNMAAVDPAVSLAKLDPYRPRKIKIIKVIDCNDWRLKVYEITGQNVTVSDSITDAAIEFIKPNVQWPTKFDIRCGFVTIHFGEEAVWLLVDLWCNDIMRHWVYNASTETPTEFRMGPSDGTNSCVWEQEITKHERDAWVKHVLSKPTSPALDAYFLDTIEIIVD